MRMGLLETHLYHVSIFKVDYIMENTFMYAAITLNYNKVMHAHQTQMI